MSRYRDLRAAHLKPRVYRELPVAAAVRDLCIDHEGILHWVVLEGDGSAKIESETGSTVVLKEHGATKRFSFPLLQRFVDGRWLIVEPRNASVAPNAFIFDKSGTPIHAFYVGDGIQMVVVDRKDKIWIGYFDEGIFGAFDAPADHPWHRFGPNGLVRLDTKGNVEFAYNRNHPNKSISDIYAMTIDDRDELWFSPYTDFFLASIEGNEVSFVLPRSPRPMEMALSIGPKYFAFFGGFQESSMVTLVERASGRLRLLQLLSGDGNTLSPIRMATRGDTAVAVAGNNLYRLDQEILLSALGPWRDENSSTVGSAVQYQDEEASYAGYDVIYGKGAHHVAGLVRPRQNPPRNDFDSGQGPL